MFLDYWRSTEKGTPVRLMSIVFLAVEMFLRSCKTE